MKLKNRLNTVFHRLRLSHFVLASTSIPLTASAVFLLRGDIPLFGLNLFFTCVVCFFLFYVEAKHMDRIGSL